jgi:molybdopterin-binding protein
VFRRIRGGRLPRAQPEEALGLKPGDQVAAIVKSTEIIIDK